MGKLNKLLLEKKYDIDGKTKTEYENGFKSFVELIRDGLEDEDMLAFRKFIREEYFYENSEPFHVDSCYTKWVYFGNRLSYDEVVNMWCETGNEKYHRAMENMAKHGINEVVEDRKGNLFTITEEDELVSDYYIVKTNTPVLRK